MDGLCFASGANPFNLIAIIKTFAAIVCSLVLATQALAAGTHHKGDRPLSIAQGSKVDLADFIVTNRITVFAFTSEYCPPCRAYDDTLLQLHRASDKLAIVKVDINRLEVHKIDWQSPTAEQFSIHVLPYFAIYGADGKLIAESDTAKAMVDIWIAKLR